MSSLSLRQLRYFDALADCRQFGKAAQRCHVSQPALSTQIRQLERALGAELVERTPRGIVLTPVGEDILARTRDILHRVEALSDTARRGRETLSGPVRLGVMPTIAPYSLPWLLPRFAGRSPGAELRVRESQTAHLTAELTEGRIDLMLAALPLGEPDFHETALFEEPFFVVLPRGHRLAARKRIPIEAITTENLLLLEEGHCLRDQALSVCRHIEPGRIQSFGATSLATLVQLVASGLGVTLLPTMAVPVEVGSQTKVVLRPLAPAPPTRTVGLAWRRTAASGAHFEALGALIASFAEPAASASFVAERS